MTAEPRRLVVVGASLAGLRAVEAARKQGFEGTVVLIGAEEHLPYDRPPLSKAFLAATAADGEPDPPDEAPFFHTEEHLAGELGVELRLGTRAARLDTDRRVVVLEDDDEVPYDALVIATGSRPRRLPGTDGLAGVHVLRTLEDARAIRAAIRGGARTVVVGAGFIGSEIASGAARHGVPVTVVEAQATPLVRAAGAEMGEALARLHTWAGTTLRLGVGVRAIEGEGRVERVVLEDGTQVPADLVVVGVGVAPETDWLAGSGLTLDDGVECDETLWTGVEGVWAAGDVASWPNPVLDGVRMRSENWTAAAEMGAAAARNALDPASAQPYGTVPYFWSDWYDARIQFVGDPRADEVLLVEGDTSRPGRWVALYRRGDRLIGALTVQGRTEVMKYRARIMQGASWSEGLALAEERKELHARKEAARAAQQER